MSAEASILTARKENTLYVPLDAIYTANNQKYVIVSTASTDNQSSGTKQKTVETGLANEDYVEVTKGITEGDIVQLPQLATGSSSSSNTKGMMQGGGFGGGMSEMGGMNRTNRNWGGQGQTSGRSGN